MKVKAHWKVVNKLWVINNFKQPECKSCLGLGYVGDEPDYAVCACATLAFRRNMAEMTLAGRLREHYQRIGKQDYKRLEYREFGTILTSPTGNLGSMQSAPKPEELELDDDKRKHS